MATNKKNANYATEKNSIALAEKKKIKRKEKIKKVAKQVCLIALVVVVAALLITGIVFAFKSCVKSEEREYLNPTVHSFEVTDIVELNFDGYGKIKIELYGNEAPKTVENFKHLVEEGYYNEKFLTISSSNDYVSFSSHGSKNLDDDHDHNDERPIKGEYYDNDVENKISHVAGVITMVKSNYASSKYDFMIMTSDKYAYKENPSKDDVCYDGSYAAFGKVVSSDMDVVQKMVDDYTGTTDKNNETEDNSISSGNVELTEDDIKQGYIDRVFTPEYSGEYTFTAGAAFTHLAIDGGEAEVLGTVTKTLVKGTEYKFRITLGKDAKAGSENKVSFTVKDKILKEGTTNGVSITNIDKENEVIFNYVFEAPITSEYTITYTSIKDVVIKDKDGNKLEGTKLNLVGGETYYFEIPATGASITGTTPTASVSAKIKIEGKYFDLGENKNISFTEEEITNKKTTYTFEAGVSGIYTISGTATDKGFEITDLDGNKINIKLPADKATDPDVDSTSAKLEAGKAYKIVITTDGLSKDTKYTLKIVEPVISVGETKVTVLDVDINAKKLARTFVAEVSGKHVFSASTEGADIIRVYNEAGALVNEYTEVGAKKVRSYAYLEEGKSYSIEVEIGDNSNFKENGTCTITIDDPTLTLSTTANTVSITANDLPQKKLTYAFTATSTSIFEFKVTDVLDEGAEAKINLKDYAELYVNGEKVEEIDYVILAKDDACEIVINLEKINASDMVSKNDDEEKCINAKIEISKTAPRISSSRVTSK